MLSNETLDKIEQDAKDATYGPWEICTRWVTHYNGGSYPTYSIRTSWIQAQLKAKMPVVDTATGLGGSPEKPSHTVWMELDDAAHIANCDPQTVLELVKMARRCLAYEGELSPQVIDAGAEVSYGHPRSSAIEWAKEDKFDRHAMFVQNVFHAMRKAIEGERG